VHARCDDCSGSAVKTNERIPGLVVRRQPEVDVTFGIDIVERLVDELAWMRAEAANASVPGYYTRMKRRTDDGLFVVPAS